MMRFPDVSELVFGRKKRRRRIRRSRRWGSLPSHEPYRRYIAIIVPLGGLTKKQSEARIQEAVEDMTKEFGGTTRFEGFGTWKKELPKRILVEGEPVVKVYSFAKKVSKERFFYWALRKRNEWKQTQVAIEYEKKNGDVDMHLIPKLD
jgi:hypothetical protein